MYNQTLTYADAIAIMLVNSSREELAAIIRAATNRPKNERNAMLTALANFN